MTLRPGGLELTRTADVLEAALELGRSDWERGLVRTATGGIVTRETRVARRPRPPIYVAGGYQGIILFVRVCGDAFTAATFGSSV